MVTKRTTMTKAFSHGEACAGCRDEPRANTRSRGQAQRSRADGPSDRTQRREACPPLDARMRLPRRQVVRGSMNEAFRAIVRAMRNIAKEAIAARQAVMPVATIGEAPGSEGGRPSGGVSRCALRAGLAPVRG